MLNFNGTFFTLLLANLKRGTEKLHQHFFSTGSITLLKYVLQGTVNSELSLQSVILLCNQLILSLEHTHVASFLNEFLNKSIRLNPSLDRS